MILFCEGSERSLNSQCTGMQQWRRILRRLWPPRCWGCSSAGAHTQRPIERDDAVYRAVEASRSEALELLKNIVNIDSGSGDVEGGKRVEELLATQLKASGADIRYEPAEAPDLPPNLVAVFRGTGKAKILIIAHIDTVFGPGTVAKRPFRIEGNRAHGPGIGDEKAGVVNAVTTLKILHDLGFKNYATITLLLDDSEELGSPGSTQLIKTLAKQNDVEFNMEPGDPPDAITVWRKGGGDIFIQVKGRPAHAGMVPQNGRNAAVELVHQLSALEGLFPHTGDGVTVNLTVIKAGDRSNIIPDVAAATLDVRFRKLEEFDAVLAKVKSALPPDRAGYDHNSLGRRRRVPATNREPANRRVGSARAGHLCRARQDSGNVWKRRCLGIRSRYVHGHPRAGRTRVCRRRLPYRP